MKVSPEMKKLLLERGTVGPAPQLPGQPPAKKGPPGRPKYRAVKTVVDGHTFDSKKEAKRYVFLKGELAAGRICQFQFRKRDVGIRLEVNGVTVCFYYPDFRYVRDGRLVVEDVKGLKTPVYKLKKKLMLACRGITVTEI